MLWWIVGSVGIVLVLVILIVRRRAAGTELISIVGLRPAPATITEAQVRDAARVAFKDDGGVFALPRDGMPPGLAGGFAVTLDGAPVFYVINSDRPYVPDVTAASLRIPEGPAREAFAAHRAWVSVDLLGGMPEASMRPIIVTMMGVLVAALNDAQTTLLYSTWLGRTALPSDLKKLAESGDMNAVFSA